MCVCARARVYNGMSGVVGGRVMCVCACAECVRAGHEEEQETSVVVLRLAFIIIIIMQQHFCPTVNNII